MKNIAGQLQVCACHALVLDCKPVRTPHGHPFLSKKRSLISGIHTSPMNWGILSTKSHYLGCASGNHSEYVCLFSTWWKIKQLKNWYQQGPLNGILKKPNVLPGFGDLRLAPVFPWPGGSDGVPSPSSGVENWSTHGPTELRTMKKQIEL